MDQLNHLTPVAYLTDRGSIESDRQDALDDSDGFITPLYSGDDVLRMAQAAVSYVEHYESRWGVCPFGDQLRAFITRARA